MSRMAPVRPRTHIALLAIGIVAFAVATLSIFDMYLPHPYDGVVLEADAPGQLIVREVVPRSGAEAAGIRPGDQIVGISRSVLRSTAHAATLLGQHSIGQTVAYLVRTGDHLREVAVRLGPRRIADNAYLYACFLGFSFFFIGLFVLLQQPKLEASQVFFVVCSLFLVFLVCRLRPASYSWVDTFVLSTGTAALVFLPASFLHFFLIFPRPIWSSAGPRWRSQDTWRWLLAALYLVPPAVLLTTVAICFARGQDLQVISGAPLANWWVLALYFVLGLTALAYGARRLPASRERRGAALVLVGSVAGLLPFLILAVAFPSFLHTERFLFYGIVPLILVPLTFAYAIVRFRLMDVRLILRKSLLYTATTAVVTAAYALAIALFNNSFRGTTLATSPYFPLVFALAIVLLFEPLRRRIQVPVDRFFFSDRARLQETMVAMGEGFTGQLDPGAVVEELVRELPRLLGLRFAALYLLRGETFERTAGPWELPATLPLTPGFKRAPRSFTGLMRMDDLLSRPLSTPEAESMVRRLAREGVDVIGDLATSRRRIGLLLLSQKRGALPLEHEEMELLRGVLHQAAIALETSHLLEERAKRAELERELEIAAAIQASLLPKSVQLGSDWDVAAVCRPARHVGGDFFAELPGPNGSGRSLVYGDVSGKSVPGALMMMAAKEALHALAISHHGDPEELMRLANLRLHELGNRSFVALGYLTAGPRGDGLRYVLAGQPPPLKLSNDGTVCELEMPPHRLPLGAMTRGRHRMLCAPVAAGEVVLAYSDGVVEAHSPAGEMFGEERLKQVLGQGSPAPDQIVARILEALDAFTERHEPYDDLTLLAVGRRPAEA